MEGRGEEGTGLRVNHSEALPTQEPTHSLRSAVYVRVLMIIKMDLTVCKVEGSLEIPVLDGQVIWVNYRCKSRKRGTVLLHKLRHECVY